MNEPRGRTVRDFPGLIRLERLRRSIPYAYWLFYDLVVAAALAAATIGFSRWFALGFIFLAVAVLFDVVEFIVKFLEDRAGAAWLREQRAQELAAK